MNDPLAAFVVVFAVVGGFELLDRTNFALIGLAAKNPPIAVWAGAAAAFATTSAIAVLLGAAFLDLLGGNVFWLRLGGGILLLGYAGYLRLVPESERRAPTGRSALSTAFLLIFLLELGDTTMVLTIIFAGAFDAPAVVFLAAASALALVAASAALIGSQLGPRVPPAVLERVVIGVLCVVGVFTIIWALAPGAFPAWLA
ncbi:MAG: TMEM165/GDT1 family protein [Thermoplasmata archaeon]|nr:TMEM165/GDT1 family protein [Thermoplasmata archaeon]